MTTHELARYLLEIEDKPFSVSIDMSSDDENTHGRRCFGEGFCGINPYCDEWTLLFEEGCLNYDNQQTKT